MRAFNLVKSLTRVINNRKGLLILCLSLAVFGVNDAWGATYYATGKVALSSNAPTGSGTVYINTSNSINKAKTSTTTTPASIDNSKYSTGGDALDIEFHMFATANDGYVFKGWSESSEGTSGDMGENDNHHKKFNINSQKKEKETPRPTKTYYGTFDYATYKVNLDPKGGTVNSGNVTEYKYKTGATLPTDVTKTGYKFDGWFNAEGSKVTAIGTEETGDKSFTAQWTANQYKVTYDAQEGLIDGLSSKTIEETYDSKYTYPIPTRDGYDFQGWFTETSGGSKITTNSTVQTAREHTLYAHWQVVNVVINNAENKTVDFIKQTETLTTTLAFPVEKATSTTNFNFPTSSNAEWTVTDYSYSNNVVTVTLSFTATENTTTRGGHKSTITLTGKNGASATGQVTAHVAMTPVLTDKVPTNKLVDDAAIDLNTLWTSTSNGAKTYTIKTWTPDGGAHNGGAVKPAINGSTLSLGDAGTLVLQLYQAEGTSSEDKTAEHTLTINRRDNHISINNSQNSYQTSIYMDGYAQIDLTATNTDYAGSPITATQTAGTDIATFYPDDKVVYSTYKLGDATWTVSQSENYKYKAANATFTIHVVKEKEDELCEQYLYQYTGDKLTCSKFGEDRAVWSEAGVAKKIYFYGSCDGASINPSITTFAFYDNDWHELGTIDHDNDGLGSSAKEYSYNLDSKTTKIKFKGGGTINKYISNVRVTRKTYLNASDFTIKTQSDNTTLIYPGKTGTGSFHVDYSLANGGDLKIVCDNSKFTIDKTTQTDVDCKSGSFNVNMTYTSQEAGNDTAHVVIYNNVYRKEITVIGITQKHQQTLNWKENFDQMSLNQEVSDAASSSHGAVTYTSDKPSVIRVDNGTTLVAVAKGEAKITATAAGDDEYEEKSIEKTISVTEKCVQYIVWTQSLMGLKLNDPNRILNAYATSEIEECTSNNGGRLVTYTSADESVVKVVNTNELQIVGVGTTTVTARQAGGLDSDGHDYEPATKENTVVVKDPSAKCEAFVYEQSGDAEQFFQMNTSEITGAEHTLNGEPAKITFRAKREYWNLAINYSKGNIVLDAYTPTGGWQQVLDCGEPPIGSYQEYSKELNRDVTKIRFRRPSGGQGYHYIADAKVEMLRYIETSTPPTFQANVGEQQQQTIYLSYSNITSDILLSMAGGVNSHFSVDKTQIIGNCGDVAKNVALTIYYAPTKNTEELGEETETLIISDGTTTTNVALKGTANRVARSIVWDIDDQNTAYTVQTVNLNAKAETNLHQAAGNVAYNISPSSTEGCGSINNNVLSFAKAGNVSVVATTIEDAKYLPAVAVTKSWTVNLTPTEVVTKPEIDGDIVYGAQLTDLKLKANTGSARNTVNQQPVEGTFAITGGDISSAGEKTITVTFTPANTDMYASCTSNISVTVQKKESDAHAHAGEIIYGAVVESSVLTNEGTTAGTWTWTDEKKDQVLEVGTHEGLKVHFTPTDQTNYNEIDGTVSLTVKKAAATLTWTTAPESADVKDKLTYTATSNHSESAITYAITEGADYATIDANTGELTITKAGTITVQASQDASTHYEAATAITVTTTLTGEFENVFSGDGNWDNPENWTYGVPTSDNPDVVISGNMTIGQSISVGSLTIEAGGSVTIVVEGDLTVNGTSKDRETYGNLFVRNGGDVTISENANVKVFDFVVESSIGTQNGTSVSGQVKHSDRVIYTNGAYIDINMDPSGKMDDTQWYAFTVPFPVDVQSGIARKEGDTFRKCTYGVEYMICEYDINQRLNTGKGWKYIKSGKLQPGRFYYFTVNGDYNVYSFKAAENTITINNTTELKVNGTGADANWNAVGNSTLTYTTISGEKVPAYVQTYVNGESRYITVATDDAQFVVGCPFFFQASEETTMILNEANETVDAHYAPRQESLDKPVCVRIAEEGKHFSDQIYLTASQEATSEYTLGRDLAKAGIGTKSAQLWMNAYGQKLSVQDATLMGDQAYYELSIYAPKAGSYELSLPKVPANAVIYLTQNGYPIWDLNETPYVIECYKGTTNEYGLLLRLQEGGSPTDMQTMRGSEKVQKIMKNQRIYINANTQLYDLMGQKVK